MIKYRLLCMVLTNVFLANALQAAGPYELIICGGRIVDGTGAPWYVADVGIRNGKIEKIGRIDVNEGEEVINAKGLIVAPGFIDMMGQTATPMLEDPKAAMNLLTQGITTINAGEGKSAAPLGVQQARSQGWQTMAEYFQLLDMKGLPLNVVQTVGHTQVRQIVIGEVDRRPSDDELAEMQELVREAMEAGAIGLSTALIYPPAVYARTKEIAELAKVAGQNGGRYYTHMRNEGDRLLEAIDEALDIGRIADTPVHIFHLKAAGKNNWPKIAQAIAKIKAARGRGQQVAADIYPYINNGLGIAALMHPRHFAKGRSQLIGRLDDENLRAEIRNEMESVGGWENWFRHVNGDWSKIVIGQTGDARYVKLTGKSVAEIAKAVGEDPWDTFFNLVKAGAFALPQSMTEANKIRLMREEFISFCTDVGPAGGSRISSHPRAFGSFPRLLSHYVRDLGVISLERAVAQASAVAANEVMAYDRGRIAEGLAADIVVFDYEQLADKATFAQPNETSRGMRYVLVNGQVVLRDGDLLDTRPGRVLRGPGFRVESAPCNVATGKLTEELASFDRMMRGFMKTHCVPGAAIAVTDHGRLVFARGYGYADVGKKTKVTPTSLFRIASISKPITAVAILQLVEQGKLKLDDKIFDILKYEPHLEDGAKFDERHSAITIRHLLEHRGGWDRDISFDGMFRSVEFAAAMGVAAPAGHEQIIRCMLGQTLDFEPGERFAYSNYGYCLLGRVIEVKTGLPYEKYVIENVLKPIGVKSMRIGKTRLSGQAEHEVRYYHPERGSSVFAEDLGKPVPAPYGAWYHESLDSHGGWLASAVDLARFSAALDAPQKYKLLGAESLKQMHARPPGLAGFDESGKPKDVFYSMGWLNRVVGEGKTNHWHTGSLPGTATVLVRRHDGRNFVALFNARTSPHVQHLGRAIDGLLHKAANEVKHWPNIDLFDNFK